MLYVDGMNGIIAHIEVIQWLYELLDSPVSLFVLTVPLALETVAAVVIRCFL